MGKPEDWSRTLDNLGVMMTHGDMSVEDAREIFASIHGFNPATGKIVFDSNKKSWWRFW